MKVALIRQRYNPYGGAERFIERALGAMGASQDLSIDLITRNWEGGYHAGRVVDCNPFYLGRVWRDWGFARAACRKVSAGGYDLVQSHERIACCDVYRAGDGVHAQWLENRARLGSWPGSLVQQATPWHRHTLRAERELFSSKRLHAVICNSQMVAGEITRHFGVDAQKLHVIYNGVDTAAFRPDNGARLALRRQLGIAPEALLFLFVGSGFERKGVGALLRAFALLQGPARMHAHLAVVGHDRKSAQYRNLASRLGIADRVSFPGPQAPVQPWYQGADCFVLPTLYDPFPNAILEALACGLPVITSRQCGAAEILEGSDSGWVCDALDHEALAVLMGALDTRRCAAMSRAARELAGSFTLERMADQMTGLYRRFWAA